MNGEPDDALLARYLMGSCSEDEKERVEEQLFVRDQVFERLCAIEEELIGRRLRGELASQDRDRFDRAYAAAPRRDRVLFTRALNSVLSESVAKPSAAPIVRQDPAQGSRWSALWHAPGFRMALAAASVVLFAGVAALSWRMNDLRSSLENVQADNDALRQQREAERQRAEDLQKRATELSETLSRERAGRTAGGDTQPARSLVATFVLTPGLVRGGRTPARVVIRPSAGSVRLQLDLEPGIDYERFRAELRSADSRVLFSQDGLRPTPADGGTAVVLTVDAALFESGEYEVVLHGASGRTLEDAAHYYFDVVRR